MSLRLPYSHIVRPHPKKKWTWWLLPVTPQLGTSETKAEVPDQPGLHCEFYATEALPQKQTDNQMCGELSKGLKLLTADPLALPAKCWAYRYVLPHPT